MKFAVLANSNNGTSPLYIGPFDGVEAAIEFATKEVAPNWIIVGLMPPLMFTHDIPMTTAQEHA